MMTMTMLWAAAWLLVTTGAQADDQADDVPRLRIALHAQAAPSPGLIVGSVMTTNGLKRALLRRTDAVAEARTFYPFHYERFTQSQWDVLIIEGWFEVVNAVIHELRRSCPEVVVLFWCLDPAFPGLGAIESIDVDGYLTNSVSVAAELRRFAPTEVVLLAADLEEMTLLDYASSNNKKLVYVGSALGLETKRSLLVMLREAAASSVGLELWGRGWDEVGPSDLLEHWRGVLPQADLARTYAGALAVLGATMDGQREAGMVNNRVFEALATGTPLIQEHFDELETLFADENLFLWRKAGDLERFVTELKERDGPTSRRLGLEARRRIAESHSYDSRAGQILDFLRGLIKAKKVTSPCSRAGCLGVAVVWDAETLASSAELFSSFGAAAELLSRRYKLHWHQALPETAGVLLGYEIVVALGSLNGRADNLVRSLTRDYTLPRHLHQRRVLVLFDEEHEGEVDHQKPAGLVYDAACYVSEIDRARLEALGFPELGLQQAYGLTLPVSDESFDEDGLVLVHDAYLTENIVEAVALALANGATRVAVCLVAEKLRTSALHKLKKRLHGRARLRLVCLENLGVVAAIAARARVVMVVSAGTTTVGGGKGEWGVVVSALYAPLSAKLGIVPHDEPRLTALALLDVATFDAEYYASRVEFAIGRALTLGRAASTIHIASPLDGQEEAGTFLEEEFLDFEVQIDAFVVGRDGSWCLRAEGYGVLACPLQSQLKVLLRLTAPECSSNVTFQAELKSNIYADTLRTSNRVTVTFLGRAQTRENTTNITASLTNHSRRRQTDVLIVDFQPRCALLHEQEEADPEPPPVVETHIVDDDKTH